MSQVSRATKNLEAPRPLKSSANNRLSHHAAPKYVVQTIEELITLIESVADSVSIGQCNPDSMSMLLSSLRLYGPQLEEYSKSTLDQAYVKFRNASQDERLSIITRMNLLELIELRAKSWQVSDGLNTYYKHKVSDVQSESTAAASMLQNLTLLDTSPSTQSAAVLNPGEVIRVSGKFTKPTKIPGKNYTKDEVVIRNADSGKVNPGAKERLVQITGPNEEKINYAKQLIEETIRRNASPCRLDGTGTNEIGAAVSCSSLTSSNSDEAQPLVTIRNLVQQQKVRPTGTLLHSLSTNDASLGEYKYTVNVGQHSIKITGDNIELVRVSKLILDEYFASREFVSGAEEAGAEFALLNSSVSTIPASHQLNSTSPFVDSGVGLNVLDKYGRIAEQISIENDDDVFVVEDDDVTTSTTINNDFQPNGLTRSRRSHFSHADTATDESKYESFNKSNDCHISYEYDRLIHFSKSPHSWELPRDWLKICELYPNIVRNQNIDDEENRFNADLYLETRQLSIQNAATAAANAILDVDDKKSDPTSDSD